MEELKKIIDKEITKMFEACLDFAQVACPEENWKALRSKVLRCGNNCIRNLKVWIDDNYKEDC